jgi:hypothetical protein
MSSSSSLHHLADPVAERRADVVDRDRRKVHEISRLRRRIAARDVKHRHLLTASRCSAVLHVVVRSGAYHAAISCHPTTNPAPEPVLPACGTISRRTSATSWPARGPTRSPAPSTGRRRRKTPPPALAAERLRDHAQTMMTVDWRRMSIAAGWAIPVGVIWFAELLFRDLDPAGLGVGVLSWLATVLVFLGPLLAAWYWRGSGLAGVAIGSVAGTAGAWFTYRLVATSLSATPISEYELGWTSFGAGVWVIFGLLAGLIAWGVSAARRSSSDRIA